MKLPGKHPCRKRGGRRFIPRGNEPRFALFAALACKQRITILKLLREREKSTREILPALGVDDSVVSRHLATLEDAGLISSRKEGVIKYYSVPDERIFQILDMAGEIIKETTRKKLDLINNL